MSNIFFHRVYCQKPCFSFLNFEKRRKKIYLCNCSFKKLAYFWCAIFLLFFAHHHLFFSLNHSKKNFGLSFFLFTPMNELLSQYIILNASGKAKNKCFLNFCISLLITLLCYIKYVTNCCQHF